MGTRLTRRLEAESCFRRVAAIVVLHVALVGWAGYRQSIVVDETGHLAAGFYHWTFQRFDLYAVNPPLVRMIASLPLQCAGYTPEWQVYSTRIADRSEFPIGRRFVAANASFMNLWRTARWACLPFSVLGAFVAFCWAKDLYGSRAGFVSLILWAFSPNVIANASLITPDAAAAALSLSACYTFARWYRSPSWKSAFIFGATLGVALLTKFTCLLLCGILPVCWLSGRLADPVSRVRIGWLGSECRQLMASLVLAAYLLNMAYFFEGSLTRLGDFRFSSAVLSGQETGSENAGNRFTGTFLGDLPVPLPMNYLLGVDHIKYEFERGYWSYLRGEHRFGGWWYYYLYGMLVKMPIGTLILLGLSLFSALRRVVLRSFRFEECLVLIPAIAVILAVSRETGFNHHLRYVLPAFPFLFIFCSQLFARTGQEWYRAICLPGVAVVLSVSGSLWCYPHAGSYFNELVFGPMNGWKHMGFSNIGWGQDILFLSDWVADHPDASPVYADPGGIVDASYYGLKTKDVPSSSVDEGGSQFPAGWYALSAHGMLRARSPTRHFLKLQPRDRAGYSILIYYLDEPM